MSGNANAIQLRKDIGWTGEIAAIAIAFDPVPIGVAMPPMLAPRATPIRRVRRRRWSSSNLLIIGARNPKTRAAAAMFDIHIEKKAVIRMMISKNFRYEVPEARMARSARRASNPLRPAATPSAKPPKNRANTGSAAQANTLGKANLPSIGARKKGTRHQRRRVGTNGGTTSVIHSRRQMPEIETTRA